MNTITFEALDEFAFVPVWIANSVTRTSTEKTSVNFMRGFWMKVTPGLHSSTRHSVNWIA